MKTIYINEDNHHFYLHPAEDMSEAGCRALVDYYASPGTVKGVLFCTNVQRALYDSNVWERFSSIEDGNLLMQNLRLLSARKVDQFAIWLQRCRELGLEGWLSMRMNDSHGLTEVAHGWTDRWHYKWPSQKWRSRPDLRRAPYRSERSWEGSYNYMLPEVRAHHLALAEEILSRWDMYGLELDWMRWGMMVPPGSETEARKVLTDVIREIRRYADAAEKRLGHRILLAHRVPSNLEACLDAGFDVITWGREGLADMVTLSSFCGESDFTADPVLWRAALPEHTVLNLCTESFGSAFPGCGIHHYDILTGNAAMALEKGFDHTYLFNECYREQDAGPAFAEYLRKIDSPEHLSGMVRRIPVTYPQACIPGTSNKTVLPVELTQKDIGADFARMEQNISLRFPYAGVCSKAFLRVAFSAETEPDSVREILVRMNTVLLKRSELPSLPSAGLGPETDLPPQAAFSFVWEIPSGILHAGGNAAELLPDAVKGSVVWAEVILLPR